jgi:hypothetical protein
MQGRGRGVGGQYKAVGGLQMQVARYISAPPFFDPPTSHVLKSRIRDCWGAYLARTVRKMPTRLTETSLEYAYFCRKLQ